MTVTSTAEVESIENSERVVTATGRRCDEASSTERTTRRNEDIFRRANG